MRNPLSLNKSKYKSQVVVTQPLEWIFKRSHGAKNSIVEHLPRMSKVMGFIPQHCKKKKATIMKFSSKSDYYSVLFCVLDCLHLRDNSFIVKFIFY
jgi:hypothetical protein